MSLDLWTNTCCSHPLGIPGEAGSNFDAAVAGVRRAAQRKLGHELGIKAEQVPLDDFKFLTRIHYKAPSDGKWGEHESMFRLALGKCWGKADQLTLWDAVDYILFINADVDLDINLNEVQDTKYVTPDELKAMFNDPKVKYTPWFRLICESMLYEWWEHLDSGLEKYLGETQIRRML